LVALQNITIKNKINSVSLDIGNNHIITSMSWYNIDETCKYLLVGTSESYTYLLDMSQGAIINKFDKYGSGK
jgi:hypothetical protein